MGKLISIIVLICLGILVGFQGRVWLERSTLKPDFPTTPRMLSILAEGTIQPASGIRLVTTLPGRKIQKLLVKQGSPTQASKTEICVFQDQPLLKLQLDLARSQKVDLATEIDQRIISAELSQLKANAKLEEARLNQLRYSAESAESSFVNQKLESSRKKLSRLKELASSEKTSAFISEQDVFDQQLELEKVQAEKAALEKSANLGVDAATRSLELADRHLEQIRALRGNSTSADLAEKIARRQYENSRLYAPIDGEVIKVHAATGDTIGNVPIVEIADLSSLVVEADVFFANMPDVKIGQSARISSPALTQVLTGEVIAISNYIGGSLLQSSNPLAMVNQETCQVMIQIDDQFTATAKKFVNLQVTVEIDTQ
jgi:HlyD family secretion protein